jgi:hypothetical protein
VLVYESVGLGAASNGHDVIGKHVRLTNEVIYAFGMLIQHLQSQESEVRS